MFKYFLFIVCICCIACKANGPSDLNFQDIEVTQLPKELKLHKDPIILDVRTPEEVAEGSINGSINIDYKASGFEDALNKLDKEKVYFVYCRSGGRSSRCMKKMKEVGFSKVYNILGGYDAISNPGNK